MIGHECQKDLICLILLNTHQARPGRSGTGLLFVLTVTVKEPFLLLYYLYG